MAKDLVKEFNEIKEKLRPEEEGLLHDYTFSNLLANADKNTIIKVIDNIAENKFATTSFEREIEIMVTLPDIIRDNINDKEVVSASFKAMETMLNTATNYIKNNDKEKAVHEVNAVQCVIFAASNLRDLYPSKLGKYTDSIYDVYKNMMKEYALRGLQNDGRNERDVSDYYHGYDPYKDVKEFETERKQVDAAWETKEQLEAAKQRIYNKFTQKEIADYEQYHTAENIKKREAQYVADLKKFVKEHDNPELRKKRHTEMDIAWSAKKIWDMNKEEYHKQQTGEEIADYEKRHAEQVKKEDAQYRQELKNLVAEHKNREVSKGHQAQITTIRLKHSDEELQKGYDNYKDVARKPKKGKKAKEVPINNEVPRRAVFIARAESKRQA